MMVRGLRLFMIALSAASATPAASLAAHVWITHPAAVAASAAYKPITLQFRRDFDLKARPRHLEVEVSADNRFILYANGRRVGEGPARGDLGHWRYERVDLGAYLKAGHNVVAAEIWNDAGLAPGAQISARTGFLISAEDTTQAWIDSGPDWRARVDRSRSVAFGLGQVMRQVGPTFYAAGPPETLDGAAAGWDWNAAHTSLTDWAPAIGAVAANETAPWTLVADQLPPMRYAGRPSGKLVRATGAPRSAFPTGPVHVAANTEAVLLVDAGQVLSAYPELVTSGGLGAEIEITYTEALYGPDRKRLSDRSAVDDGKALGLTDTVRLEGGSHRNYLPLWWRTWRFVQLRIKTGAEPVTLERFATFETGYPFVQRARFVSDDAQLNAIWRIGWRTTKVDAHETFMDTAYWEQFQYIGDARIEALISYAVSGDPRLAIQALDAFDHSRVMNGSPQAAWPSSGSNSIPPFGLLWIGMLHDYWMAQPDTAVLQRTLPGARSMLDGYAPYVHENGLVGTTPGWAFIDWRRGLSERATRNSPPKPDSCIITLLYLGALQQAAELEQAVGDPARGENDRAQALKVRTGVQNACWDAERGLYSDTPEKRAFSQHANALAVLYDVAPPARQAQILQKVIVPGHGTDAPGDLTGVTFYFAFYLARAFEHAGLTDHYLDLLGTWRTLLAQHFTTWPEEPDPTRSDSHAWSAHPTADLLALVAGIEPAAPGFGSVRIAPHLGALKRLDAAEPTPKGLVQVRYAQSGDRLTGLVTLPPGLSGDFDWAGQTRPLHPGANPLALRRTLRPPAGGDPPKPRY